MGKGKFLNSKEIKKITEYLTYQFGISFGKDDAYLENSKGKIFLINKEIADLDLAKLRTDRFGLYVCERRLNNFRISMQGAQLLAEMAKKSNLKLKNVITLTKDETIKYFSGEDLSRFEEGKHQVIVVYNEDVIGAATLKDGQLHNFMPKIFRGTVIV